MTHPDTTQKCTYSRHLGLVAPNIFPLGKETRKPLVKGNVLELIVTSVHNVNIHIMFTNLFCIGQTHIPNPVLHSHQISIAHSLLN